MSSRCARVHYILSRKDNILHVSKHLHKVFNAAKIGILSTNLVPTLVNNLEETSDFQKWFTGKRVLCMSAILMKMTIFVKEKYKFC